MEVARRMLFGQRQELGLVERLAHGMGRVRHHRQVGEADLILEHSLDALAELGHMGAHRQVVAGDAARDFAVDPDPVVGAVEAFQVPLAARLELRREARLLELQHIDASLVVNHLVTDRELGRADVQHAIIVSNIGTKSKDRKSTRLNSSHSQISYAVFCLKKKNRHHMDFSELITYRGRNNDELNYPTEALVPRLRSSVGPRNHRSMKHTGKSTITRTARP